MGYVLSVLSHPLVFVGGIVVGALLGVGTLKAWGKWVASKVQSVKL